MIAHARPPYRSRLVARRTIDLLRARQVPGWMTPRELGWLAQRARDAKVIIEVGSWKGRSTRALADNTTGVVYAIDPWAGETLSEDGTVRAGTLNVWREFAWHLRDHLRTGRVRPLKMLSAEALPRLLTHDLVTTDLVFLDGDHREASVAADIDAVWPLLREGGILAGHDYGNVTWPGVSRAVDARFGAAVQTVESIWWVVKP